VCIWHRDENGVEEENGKMVKTGSTVTTKIVEKEVGNKERELK
jgi:hypothetical protein